MERKRSDAESAGEHRGAGVPIRIGVSACLLGQPVRFDAGHKRDRFLTDVLAPFVEWVPVCPEVETGMGVPREAVRLVRRGAEIRMIAEKSGRDHTGTMRAWAAKRVRQLQELGLCGYVLKKGSPSCGMERVRIYGASGMPAKSGRGLFADELIGRLTHLPVEEEGRLNDAALRENFLERVFAYRRLQMLFGRRWRWGDVVEFHAAHELQLMAHSPQHCRELGRLVAERKRYDPGELRTLYESMFMEALSRKATVRRHVHVLQHVIGHFSAALDAASRSELHRLVDDYRRGHVPLIVPLAIMRYHVRVLDIECLARQTYLDPHPKELLLRNHV